MATRTCFVIMPISSSKSARKKGWTFIYEKIIKPAVEGANLGFKCKRSTATRGNILKDIIVGLYESDVVIADLTDQNPNVFYELGVRHALKDGTIVLTQNRKFAKLFDLNNYASHVYDWKTKKGQDKMINELRLLLEDYDNNPNKPDNPVSDFLRIRPVFRGTSRTEIEKVIEFDRNGYPHIIVDPKHLSSRDAVGFLLLANAEKGISLKELKKQVSMSWKKQTSNQISRTISQMKGWVIKEGPKRNYIYRLSGTGRNEIVKIIEILTRS